MAIKIWNTCIRCMNEEKGTFFAFGELSNDEYSLLHCSNGHETKYFTVLPDYQIYFDHGIDAYFDSNYFEAFTSIYHAWEQFVSTFSEMILIVQTGKPYSEIKEFLKGTSNNSVKLEGSFNSLFISYFSVKPPKLSNAITKLRNDIIHGKRNPEKQDVEKCMMGVYDFIKPIEIRLLTGLQPPSPTTFFEVYANSRLESLKKEGIYTDVELENGDAITVQAGQYSLGRSPSTSDMQTVLEQYDLENLLNDRKKIYKINSMMEKTYNIIDK